MGGGLLIYYAFCWSGTCSYSPSNFEVSQSSSEERLGFMLDIEVDTVNSLMSMYEKWQLTQATLWGWGGWGHVILSKQ